MFYDALNFVLENEGGYSNNPNDKGGKTRYGISQRAHPEVDIDKLTLIEAQNIYMREYWNGYYKLLSREMCIRLFDLGVNIGKNKAVQLLQTTLNTYFDTNLALDGIFGHKTLQAVKNQNQTNLYSVFIFEASLYYKSLNSPFFIGWLNRLYKKIT